ncbi:MAG TPA: hypothetical protein VLO11_11730 [Luteolibacter sp.]|nr:hypothetical protein [Luteolibacter sp.]
MTGGPLTRGAPLLPGLAAGVLCLIAITDVSAMNPDRFYTQDGTDRTFEEIMESGDLPKGRNSTDGVRGSIVKVNHELLKNGPNAKRRIPKRIFLHTLGSAIIRRSQFPRWSRWYQEDGNTQVFRLFKGETNVRNSRPFAARIEAYSEVEWEEGDWHEWVGTYTILKPHRAIIFQARNNVNDWSVQLNMDDAGNVILNRRVGEDEVIASDMVGKPFHVRVRDNGLDYEVFLNGKKAGDGSFPRPEGQTCFRWGLYRGSKAMNHDAMILVTGAEIDPRHTGEAEEEDPGEVSTEPGNAKDDIPQGRAIPKRIWTNKQGQQVTAPAIHKAGEDILWIKTKDGWIAYPLTDLSEADRVRLAGSGDIDR